VHPGQSTWQFPEGGGYDTAFASGEFLNSHSFAQVFPFVDLTDASHARRAVRDALSLAANANAGLHRCGYNPTLLARVVEWFLQQPDGGVRHAVLAEMKTFVTRMRGKLSNDAQDLLGGAIDGRLSDWRFAPADLLRIAGGHAAELESAGDPVEAARIRRYMEGRAAAIPVVQQDTPTVPTVPAMPSSTVSKEITMEQHAETAFHLDHVRSVAVFGAGRYGRLAAELAGRCGWSVAAFVDNNANLWNTDVRGVPVRSPATLREEPVDLVIVASHANMDAIAGQLEGLGLVYGSDFIPFLAPIQIGSVKLKLTV
jgi:hypothetical protein